MEKRTVIVALLVLASSTMPPASAAAGPRVGAFSSPELAEGEWAAVGTWHELYVIGVRPADRLESCVLSSWTETPRVVLGSMAYLPNVRARDCRIDTSHGDTGSYRHSLSFTFEGRSYSGSVSVNVDIDEPSVTIDPIGDPLVVGPVTFSGVARDAYSGPLDVRVRLRDTLGLHEERIEQAVCEGCGVFEPCGGRPRTCGAERPWSVTAMLPPGQWIATPVARDLAGNEASGDWIDVLVVG